MYTLDPVTVLVMKTASLILETPLSFYVIENLLEIIVLKPTFQTVNVHKQHKRNKQYVIHN